jgi:hypothetical protein
MAVEGGAGAREAPLVRPPEVLASIVVAVIVLLVGVAVTRPDATNGGSNAVAPPAPGASEAGRTGVDAFERADADDLAAAPPAPVWTIAAGRWGVRDTAAAVIEPAGEEEPAIAVTDLGAADGTVSARASVVSNGWGLVFRYRGTFNYWVVTASPQFAALTVRKVVDGELQTVASLDLVPVRDGMVLGIQQRGSEFDVLVDGEVLETFDDPHLVGATQVGMVAMGGAAPEARWDDFRAMPAVGGVTSESVVATEVAGS